MKSTMVIAALVSLTACVSPEAHRRALSANQALQDEISSLGETQRALGRENEMLRKQLEDVGKRAADADWVRDQKEKLTRLLRERLGAGTARSDIPGVEVVRTSEGFAFRVLAPTAAGLALGPAVVLSSAFAMATGDARPGRSC